MNKWRNMTLLFLRKVTIMQNTWECVIPSFSISSWTDVIIKMFSLWFQQTIANKGPQQRIKHATLKYCIFQNKIYLHMIGYLFFFAANYVWVVMDGDKTILQRQTTFCKIKTSMSTCIFLIFIFLNFWLLRLKPHYISVAGKYQIHRQWSF